MSFLQHANMSSTSEKKKKEEVVEDMSSTAAEQKEVDDLLHPCKPMLAKIFKGQSVLTDTEKAAMTASICASLGRTVSDPWQTMLSIGSRKPSHLMSDGSVLSAPSSTAEAPSRIMDTDIQLAECDDALPVFTP
jgi:hypothetical protein